MAATPAVDLRKPLISPINEAEADSESGVLKYDLPKPTFTEELGCVLNMALSILGPGVLSIPYAISKSGLVIGTLMFVAALVMNDYMIVRLIDILHLMPEDQEKNFENLTELAIGPRCRVFLQGNLVVLLLGFVCGNFVAIGDLSHTVVKYLGFTVFTKTELLLLIIGVIIVPLAMVRDLSLLGKWTSPLGMLTMFLLLVSVIYKLLSDSDVVAHPHAYTVPFDVSFLLTFPIATFAFTVSPYVFPIFFEQMMRVRLPCGTTLTRPLDEEAKARFRMVTHYAMLLSFIIYMSVGYGGFITFGKDTEGNLLLSYAADGLTTAVSGIMCLTVVICIPLNMYPLRLLIEGMIAPEADFSWKRFIALSLLIIGAALSISLAVPDMAKIFDVTGATGCLFVSYLLPCWIVGRLEGKWGLLQLTVAILGFITSAISLYQIVPSLWEKDGSPSPPPPSSKMAF